MAQLQKISPQQAKILIDKGAVLIDIREGDERARASISGSAHMPLSRIETYKSAPAEAGQVIVYHCKTGNRTSVNAAKLQEKTQCEAYILDGGIDAWRAAGLPLASPVAAATERKPPIELMRQVQIVAGSLALTGVVLGMNVAPEWFYLSGFVGAGLLFSGVSGFCPMAYLVKKMPWNRGFV